jgi:hypothetical protein
MLRYHVVAQIAVRQRSCPNWRKEELMSVGVRFSASHPL